VALLPPHVVRVLTSPVVVGALVVLVVNDHVLKARWPGLVTGLASDVAGLLVAPALVAAAIAVVTRRTPGVTTVLAIGVAVGAGFAAVELVPVAADAYETAAGQVGSPLRRLLGQPGTTRVVAVSDPLDLLAVPAVLVAPWLWGREAHPVVAGSKARERPSSSPDPEVDRVRRGRTSQEAR
jgi:hypothetical protein